MRVQIPWLKRLNRSSDVEQQESLLGSTNEKVSGLLNRHVVANSWATTARAVKAAALVALLFFCWLLLPANLSSPSDRVATTQFLHLIIPDVHKADSNLCKAILTAQVLNYPIPIILSGDEDENGAAVPDADRPRRRLTETYRWLESQPVDADDGIVILLDSPRTWFQLGPEVLLQRYYGIIHQADRKRGSSGSARIVMTAQKDCAAATPYDILCRAARQTPSARGASLLYPGTGAIMGPVRGLRDMFQRVIELSDHDSSLQPLELFTEIFGEQEILHAASSRAWWGSQTLRHALPATAGDSEERRETSEAVARTIHDFGITLDYHGDLGLAFPSDDTTSLWHGTGPVPVEVEQSMPPFWTVSGREPDLPREQSWKDLALFAATPNTAAPAMLHLPSADTTTPPLTEQYWPQHWMQPYARALYTAAQRLPPTIVAHVADGAGHVRIFWNKMRMAARDTAGAWTANATWTFWEDLCSDEAQWKEVFRDDKGEWRRIAW